MFSIGASYCSGKELTNNNNVNLMMLKLFYFILAIPIILSLLYTLFDIHAFCFELYNAIQESGLTVKEFVEAIQ